jgi:hypothetical protein
MLLKYRQLVHRIRVALNRHGLLIVPDLHRETFTIKARFDYAHDGWFSYSLACIQSHLRRLLDRGQVERTETDDGMTAWQVTSDGRLTEGEIAVRGGYERGLRLQTCNPQNGGVRIPISMD